MWSVGSTSAGRPQDLFPHVGPIIGREGRGRAPAAQRNGLAQRGHEVFAMGTGSEVSANLQTDILGQLIVDKCRQLTKNMETLPRRMPMGLVCGASVLLRGGTLYHDASPFAT